MSKWTTEFKVGLFVLAAMVLVVLGWAWSVDGVRPDETSYRLVMDVASSDGLWEGSQVRLAGVEIGAVDTISIEGDHAELTLKIRTLYQLPSDSDAELKASGLLGDLFVRVYPGTSDTMLKDMDRIKTRSNPGDIDKITRNLEKISDDISAVTGVLKKMAENDANRQHVESTLANADQLTELLREIAAGNKADIAAIVQSVRRLSEALEGHVDTIGGNVNEEVDKLQELTDQLNAAASDMTSITGKIDRGEGTIGALVNDDETIDALNETIHDVKRAVKSFTGIRPEVYYTGRFYFGTEPKDTETFYYGNPLAFSGANNIGLRLRTHEDFWYDFEINDYPQGVISQKEVLRENTGVVTSKWTRDQKYRFTFQMEKRWGPVSVRLGVKEGGGGVGATFYAVKDRLQTHIDVFDFFFGSYPAIESRGIPNVRVGVRGEPWRNMYVEAGAEQIILGAKYGFFTGYVGLGFRFTDDDIKWLLGSLPLNF
jgi:phospholipid/cholesterol/gamma-HCH transport system substrate-binding protein